MDPKAVIWGGRQTPEVRPGFIGCWKSGLRGERRRRIGHRLWWAVVGTDCADMVLAGKGLSPKVECRVPGAGGVDRPDYRSGE